MYAITRRLKDFAYAHRLTKGYQGKCSNIHGHNAHIEVQIMADKLDQFDMVVDFTALKILDAWVDSHLDHAILMQPLDGGIPEGTKTFIMPNGLIPTAEAIAFVLFHTFRDLLQSIAPNCRLISVRVWETEDSSATYWEAP